MRTLDNLYVNRLLYFYYVAVSKNITLAAREAGLHQSAMSRQIIKLEKEVGISLMTRHSDGIKLTRKGEELFEFAKKIFIEVQESRKKLEETEELSGRIRICTTYSIANYILSSHLINFKKIYPNIHFSIVCSDHAIDVIKNNADIIIRPYDPIENGLIQEYLFDLQGKLYASEEYIKENGSPKNYDDIKNHKFITVSGVDLFPFNSQYINWFANIEGYTEKRNSVMEVNTLEFLLFAAQAGLGLISAYSNMKIIESSNLINVAPDISGPVLKHYFCYSQKEEISKKLQILKNYLKTNLIS